MHPLWRRLVSCLEQHLAHGSRRNRDPETLELADDPFVSPVRVLPSEAKDELAERALERRSTGPSVRVCPAAGDKLAMPAKQRLRLEREARPRRLVELSSGAEKCTSFRRRKVHHRSGLREVAAVQAESRSDGA